ncbi:MAG: nucleotide-binding protein [Bacteroidales bacterium]|nr:nucleotide-binding protein [Bacteroidales bacterium]
MAKKRQAEDTAKKAVLTMPSERLIPLLEKQVEAGKKLLHIPVAQIHGDGYSGYGYGVYCSTVPQYDETQYNAFKTEFHKWKDFTAEIFKQAFDIPNNEYHSGFVRRGQAMFFTGNEDWMKEDYDEINDKISYIETFIQKIPLLPSAIEDNLSQKGEPAKFDKKKVFIVHGHSDALKTKVARVVEQMGLKAIILHEQEDYGKTVIEKFEENAEDIGFAIILLTADDRAVSHADLKKEDQEKDYKAIFRNRARQNVIFEMGFFIGKLGRAHVFELQEDGIEEPSDLKGIIYTPVDEEDMWRFKLAKRLKAVGYEVNTDVLL